LRLAASNYRPEGRGVSRAAFVAGDERFSGDEQLSVGGEGWESGGAAGKAQSDLQLATSNYLPEGRDSGAAG